MKTRIFISAVAVLAGCGTIHNGVRDDIRRVDSNAVALSSPVSIPKPASRVAEVRGPLMPAVAIARTGSSWLKRIRIALELRNPSPLSAIVELLAEKGINVSSELPLSSYTWVGKLNETDAETAIQTILGSLGLDYQADDVRKVVVIRPMASRTWFLNLGNRKASFSTNANQQGTGASGSQSGGGQGSSTGNSTQGGGQTGGTGGTGMAGGGAPGGMGGSMSSGGQQGSQASGSNQSSVSATDDFWASLNTEISSRLTILVPRGTGSPNPMGGGPLVPNIAGANQPMANRPDSGNQEFYNKRQVGTYSINPETGAISVQAPHWIISDLDAYFQRVQEQYNTSITFTGELVLVTSTQTDSSGIDLSAFASWAGGKYSAVLSNGALGGVSVSLPVGGGLPSVTAGTQSVAGPLMGMGYQKSTDALQLFNAYLSQIGQVSVVQRPVATTTSGIPVTFSKITPKYYNSLSQTAASGGTGSAATATQNTIVTVPLGMTLTINPRLDVATGLVRAQITLLHTVESGSQTLMQTVNSGNTSTSVPTVIPISSTQTLMGEVLLRDGDLVVLGGQSEDNLTVGENGLPSKDGPLGGIFGVKNATKASQTYYFALRVAVNRRQ